MKIALLIFISLITPLAIGEMTIVKNQLKSPDSIHTLKKPNQKLYYLNESIKSNNLGQIYKELESINSSNIKNGEQINLECINFNIWLLYYVSMTPFYSHNYDDRDNNWLVSNVNQDINQKAETVIKAKSFADNLTEGVCKDYGLQRRDIAQLSSLYLARIVRSFHDYYDPDIDATQDRIKEKYNKSLKEEALNNPPKEGMSRILIQDMNRRIRYFNNKLTINKNRNIWVKVKWESIEKPFVQSLIAYHPRNARQVYQYIHMAGYEGDEAGELIDRTVGRSSATEYLYKGENGRRHDRKVKPPAKKPKR